MSDQPLPARVQGEPGRPRSASKSRLRWMLATAVALAAALVLGGGAYLFVAAFGGVYGTEFCPDTFQRRSFAFYEIPWIGIQVRGIERDDVTGPVEQHVLTEKYVVPKTAEPLRWDLVVLLRIPGEPVEGDAHLLTKYLDARDESGKVVWLDWSEENPELAKIFWPAVAEAARKENYLVMPDLFSQARGATSAEELKEGVAQVLRTDKN